MSTPQRAKDWNHWFYLHSEDVPRPMKSDIAAELGLTASEFSKRLSAKYNPLVSDEEARKTAAYWNQTVEYVRKKFPRKAAA